MTRIWVTIAQKTVVFAIMSGILLAVVSTLMNISENFIENATYGAIAGVVTGIVVSLSLGATEVEPMPGEDIDYSIECTSLNAIVGMWIGAITLTILVPIMRLSMTGPITCSPSLVPLELMLGALIGPILGSLIGVIIGLNWRWLRL